MWCEKKSHGRRRRRCRNVLYNNNNNRRTTQRFGGGGREIIQIPVFGPETKPGHCAPGSKRRLLLCENHLVTTYNTIKRSPASRTGYKVNVGRVHTSVCAYYNKRTKSAVFRKFFRVDYLFCFFLLSAVPFPRGTPTASFAHLNKRPCAFESYYAHTG